MLSYSVYSVFSASSADAGFRAFIEGLDPVTVPLDRFSVEETAKKLNISYSSLARLAKERLGMSLKQYVLSAKIEEAKKLLGSRPVKEVSLSVGIDDTRYFYKLFRRHTGMSCAEFAEQKQIRNADSVAENSRKFSEERELIGEDDE